MKGSVRLIVLLALAGLFAVALILPQVGSPPTGEAWAVATPTPDFSFTGGKAEVTHETANCGSGSFVVSCQEPYWDSDSYEVNAAVDATYGVSASGDLNEDVTENGLAVIFLTGTTCANPYAGDLISLQVIPGNAMHKTVNTKWTIYAFEGNVPQDAFYYVLGAVPLYDHLEMNLKILNSNPANSSLHVEGNADFCDWSNSNNPAALTGQPVSMVFDIAGLTEGSSLTFSDDNDTDIGCVDLMPEYKTRDVSSAACVGLP